jgi:hypothetical protein
MDMVSVDLRAPGVALVSLSGDHELYDALRLQSEIRLQLDSGRSIIVDLTETVFVDSSIVGVVLTPGSSPRSPATTTASCRKDHGRGRATDVRNDRDRRDPPGRRARRA